MSGAAPHPDDLAASEDELLLAYLRGRDVECPRCGYNLRDRHAPTCPECNERLRLGLRATKTPVLALLAAVLPGGFCATSIGLVVVLSALFGSSGFRSRDWPFFTFLAASALFGAGVVALRRRYLAQRPGQAWLWAAAIWAVHILIVGLLIRFA